MFPSLTHSGSCSTRTSGYCDALAAELPVGGRPAPIQQPGLREQEHAHTHRPEPADLTRRLPQPGRERRVAHRATAQSANEEHGVECAFDPVEMLLGDEGQYT